MRIPKTANHTVRKQILGRGRHRFRQYRHRFHQIILQIRVKLVHEIGIIIDYHTAIPRTFRPNPRIGIKAIIRKTCQTPLADAGTVHHIIDIVFASFSVSIFLVIFQNQTNTHNITCLQQIPIIMRHTVRNDIIRPFLESSRIDFHLVRIIGLQIIIQKII